MNQSTRDVIASGSAGDRDIAWVINLHRSRAQLEWCLPLLREHYPVSRVVLINDGDDTERYDDIAERYGCDYRAGAYLWGISTSHLFVRRLLTAMVGGPESYCFKIDPDTRIWRRFTRLPSVSSMFGTLERVSEGMGLPITGPPNVQGGCMGMTRDVAIRMLESASLTQDTLHLRALETWARCEDARRTVALARFCDDFVLSWLADHVGFPLVECPEVLSRWRRPVGDNSALRYAVTHPHKLRPLEGPAATAAV
jgi:hypothetical protein